MNDRGRRRQASIVIRGLAGRRPRIPVSFDALERRAQELMSPEGFAYVAGAAGRESTMAANRQALDRVRIVPRVLRDVSSRDLSVDLFGRRLPVPLLLCPIGVLEMAHRNADVAVARAAAAEGIPFVFSSQASVAMETCAKAMGDAPRWFQLYWSRNDELARSFVRRAERCGCEAIVVTLDTTFLGWGPRDLDLGYTPFVRGRGIAQYTSDPVFLELLNRELDEPSTERPPLSAATVLAAIEIFRRFRGGFSRKLRSGAPRAAVQRFLAVFSRPTLTWANLSSLREMTSLPIVLKGIQHPDDARRAVDHGVNAVMVSNHGGRQLDGAIGSLDALPGIVDAIEGRIPVLFDSGIRAGADIFKALALGAAAVGIGRPYVYALAVAGEEGVRELLANLIAELDLTLAISGYRSVKELDPAALTPLPSAWP